MANAVIPGEQDHSANDPTLRLHDCRMLFYKIQVASKLNNTSNTPRTQVGIAKEKVRSCRGDDNASPKSR